MDGLVLVVLRAREVDVGELVEGERAIPLRRGGLAVRMRLGELAHALVAGKVAPPVAGEIAAAQRDLDAGVEQAGEQAVLESLVEVAHAPELGGGPRVLDAPLVAGEALRREVAGQQALEQRLGGEHARLDREVDALEPGAVQESARVAAQEQAVGRELRHRPPAALGDRLGAVGDRLAALEQRPHQRMGLEALEVGVRVAGRIARVEPGHEPDRPVGVAHAVDEAAAEGLAGQREPHGVDDAPPVDARGRHLPQLLHAG